jgi:hypothetical protein
VVSVNVRLVVSIVGAVLIVSILGIVALAWQGMTVPDVLQNVAVGCLTGLVGLLVPSGGGTPAE